MNRQSVIRTRLLTVLLVLALCASMTVPALAYEETTLYSGCRGEAVRALQQVLIDLGCLQGSADGIFGVRTEEAVRAFQLRSGLTPDGLAGTKTRTVLASARAGSVPAEAPAAAPAPAEAPAYKPTTLYSGCSGEEVRVLQQQLIDLGYLRGTADGTYGAKTEEAVRAFQHRNGLTPDGLAGAKTRAALEKEWKGPPAAEHAESSPDVSPKGTDWAALERKSRQVLQKEGHSTAGLNYLTHFYAPRKDSGLDHDCFSICFYKSRETSVYDWTYAVDFDQDGNLVQMCTKDMGEGKPTHIDHVKDTDINSALLAKAKNEARTYLERRGRSSLVPLVDGLQVSQISFSKDGKETWYTLDSSDGSFMIRVRVLPSVRVDYFTN